MPATLSRNADEFRALLAVQYRKLFTNDPDYGYAAAHCTPQDLAEKMTDGLTRDVANKDGKAILAVCRMLGIKHTYDSIRKFLAS